MKFSVLVPTYNNEKEIGRCLNALLGQDYPKEDYEIIVVNDGSTDGTAEVVKGYGVRIIDLDRNMGRVFARQEAAKNAMHPNLAFCDARVVVESDWLKKIRDAGYLPQCHPGIYGGDYEKKIRELGGVDLFWYLLHSRIYPEQCLEEFLTADNFNKMPKGTTSFACKKDMFLRNSPKRLDQSVSDDVELLKNIIDDGNEIMLVKDISYMHLKREGVEEIVSHSFHRGVTYSDYYFSKNGPHRRKYLLFLASALFYLVLSLAFPIFLPAGLASVLLLYIIAVAYFSKIVWDVPVFGFYSALMGAFFLSGIIFRRVGGGG